MAWKIVDWVENYEDARSIRIRYPQWYRARNDAMNTEYIEVMTGHKNGERHMCAWHCLLALASKSHSGELPWTVDMIAKKSWCSVVTLKEAIPRLIKVGWLVADVSKIVDSEPSEGLGHSRTFSDTSCPVEGHSRTGIGKGREGKVATKSHHTPKLRKKNPIWDVLCELCNITTESKTSATLLGRVVKDLKERGATVDEIRIRAERHKAAWPEMELTITSIEKHWDRFAEGLNGQTPFNPGEVREI